MKEVKQLSSRHTGMTLIAIVSASFLLYVLSPIPCEYAANHFGNRNTHTALQYLYFPFRWTHDHTSLRGPIDTYGNFAQRL